jgi:hypothetical protein
MNAASEEWLLRDVTSLGKPGAFFYSYSDLPAEHGWPVDTGLSPALNLSRCGLWNWWLPPVPLHSLPGCR